ncbi:MAG: heavy metal translocating P-type ATPase [Oscillatoriaceae bacterium SKW80]|nr:heavy metal translocating P-type ATPase [Oscillatoriaceae bacterium SKYG93]MCX8122266.1 heavy metal translocating P-type ATPase [Oscillatoriaceae bacterium SKW80]MDW8454552.1 heavy metal translocating P-type ATPase [Oscillatoriaceae cyanobacterium SKYGB_i_bin93]HIK29414.1 heavy metal translocating P-type ATPase [Oscillatoriaceae cyanobacterium M7585_C2015_266]
MVTGHLTSNLSLATKDWRLFAPKIKTQEPTWSVIHTCPGRSRLRVPQLRQDVNFARRLEKAVRKLDGVKDVRISQASASVVITYTTKIKNFGDMFKHALALATTNRELEQIADSQENTPTEENPWSELKLPILATIVSLLAELLRLPIAPPLVAATLAVATLPVAKRAVESICKNRKLNIDCLDLIAVTLTSLQGSYLTPSLMLTLHELGDAIRERTARSTQRQTLELLNTLSAFAWVERNSQKQLLPIKEIQQGDIVIACTGELIPVDGRVLRGQATIDEQRLTGESMPVFKQPGDEVYASTYVREGEIYIVAERVGSQTRAGVSIQIIKDAPVHDTRMGNYAAQIAERALAPALLLSAFILATTKNITKAASILTLDFVTGIRVSVPTTVLASLTAAARRGILIRSGRALEQLAKVNAVVFDKTGTLTTGNIVVVDIQAIGDKISGISSGLSKEQTRILELAAAAEYRLTHPVASAIVRCAREKGIRLLRRGEWEYQIGLGVRAEIDGETVLVGSDRFLHQQGVEIGNIASLPPGTAALFVASNGHFLGTICYADPLRPESLSVVRCLQLENIETHILTGDSLPRARAVAAELGISEDKIHAHAFPEQKAQVVEKLHASGKTVAFVGDGINDSAALSCADVSVSFGEGSDVARETADVVLMSNDLNSLVEALALAKQTMQIIHQNNCLCVFPNLAALGLATTIGIHPLVATAVHNGSALAASVNGLRPLLP